MIPPDAIEWRIVYKPISYHSCLNTRWRAVSTLLLTPVTVVPYRLIARPTANIVVHGIDKHSDSPRCFDTRGGKQLLFVWERVVRDMQMMMQVPVPKLLGLPDPDASAVVPELFAGTDGPVIRVLSSQLDVNVNSQRRPRLKDESEIAAQRKVCRHEHFLPMARSNLKPPATLFSIWQLDMKIKAERRKRLFRNSLKCTMPRYFGPVKTKFNGSQRRIRCQFSGTSLIQAKLDGDVAFGSDKSPLPRRQRR